MLYVIRPGKQIPRWLAETKVPDGAWVYHGGWGLIANMKQQHFIWLASGSLFQISGREVKIDWTQDPETGAHWFTTSFVQWIKNIKQRRSMDRPLDDGDM